MFILMVVATLLLLQISSRLKRIADSLEKQTAPPPSSEVSGRSGKQ
jgi:hypothetical protein